VEDEDDEEEELKKVSSAPPPERKAAKDSRAKSTALSEEMPSRTMPKRSSPVDSKPPAKKAKASPAPEEKKAVKKEKAVIDVVALAAKVKAEVLGRAKKSRARKKSEGGDEAKEPKKRKKESEVVEVDKILKVKANVKGGLLYQIMWMDNTTTWEPEDNVMDDDLIDEFEAAEQAKAYADDDIKVGSEVEVKNIADGFENSWTAATVTKKDKKGQYTVEFTGFVDDDGEADSESGVSRERLRLVPEEAPKGWAPIVGEIIEVNEDDCWWEARVVEITGKKAKLQLRVSDEYKNSTIGAKKLRPCGWLNMANKRAK